MTASANGPFFPDWEFQTLFGITREQMRSAIADFPNLSASNNVHMWATNYSMLMLTTYPIKEKDKLKAYQLDLHEVARVLVKTRKSLGKPTAEFLDLFE
ncbi:MAG TPA: hypothetical protein VLV55_01790 [Rhizomicrobium sp.]|nr:hypothetical protein [Rhizomicrobium sp.]